VVSPATIIQAEEDRENHRVSESSSLSGINRVSDINLKADIVDRTCEMARSGLEQAYSSIGRLYSGEKGEEEKRASHDAVAVRKDQGGFSPRRRMHAKRPRRGLVTYVSRFLSRNHISASCIAQTAAGWPGSILATRFSPLFLRTLRRSQQRILAILAIVRIPEPLLPSFERTPVLRSTERESCQRGPSADAAIPRSGSFVKRSAIVHHVSHVRTSANRGLFVIVRSAL